MDIIDKRISKLLKAKEKEWKKDFYYWHDRIVKAQREETIRDIRKWTKGRNVTKDALRNYLNSLDKPNKK